MLQLLIALAVCPCSIATVTVVVGMIQMRELDYVTHGEIELDNILLLLAQSGVYIYNSFSIVGGHFTMSVSEVHCAVFMGVVACWENLKGRKFSLLPFIFLFPLLSSLLKLIFGI